MESGASVFMTHKNPSVRYTGALVNPIDTPVKFCDDILHSCGAITLMKSVRTLTNNLHWKRNDSFLHRSTYEPVGSPNFKDLYLEMCVEHFHTFKYIIDICLPFIFSHWYRKRSQRAWCDSSQEGDMWDSWKKSEVHPDELLQLWGLTSLWDFK